MKGVSNFILFALVLLILLLLTLALFSSALWSFLNDQIIKAFAG